MALLILFLRSWRTAVISFVTIPLSLLIAVIALNQLGYALNTMTLGGLAVAIGVVVDDAIIDVENIARRTRQASEGERRSAFDALVLNASVEVRRPIVLATLVVGLVFFPILLLPGIQGLLCAAGGVVSPCDLCIAAHRAHADSGARRCFSCGTVRISPSRAGMRSA